MSYARAAPLVRAAQIPALLVALVRLVRDTDVVLLRSPGHPALFARLVADALRVRHVTKWAGYYGPFDGERLPSRVERWMVGRRNAPVLVYGEHDAAHLVPFPPALMTAAEIADADALAADRRWAPPWRCLSVGRLLAVKGFDLALDGLAWLRAAAPEVPWEYTLVGSGPEEDALRARLGEHASFLGWLEGDALADAYATAHVVIMPGVKEGWPKIVAEAWAHGAVPVAASAGLVPWIMGGKDAGAIFEPTAEGLGTCLTRLLRDPAQLPAMSARGRRLVDALSLESFGARLVELLSERWAL
jgi:glycosyltransferase involved in cell wall biosynthesis